MTVTRATRSFAAAACLAVTLAGCGHKQTIGPDRIVQVGLTEYRLTPQNMSVSAGPLTFVVHNFGRLVHNLAVLRNGRIAAETPPIAPGSSALLAVDLVRGSYEMASNLFDDQSLGTYGTLTVTATNVS